MEAGPVMALAWSTMPRLMRVMPICRIPDGRAVLRNRPAPDRHRLCHRMLRLFKY
jgi:hypothetical protein